MGISDVKIQTLKNLWIHIIGLKPPNNCSKPQLFTCSKKDC